MELSLTLNTLYSFNILLLYIFLNMYTLFFLFFSVMHTFILF